MISNRYNPTIERLVDKIETLKSENALLRNEIEYFRQEIQELDAFICALGQKGPHLHGCAKTLKGGWLCEERCLVTKYQEALDTIRKYETNKPEADSQDHRGPRC
jgi:chromosome segregation ATPase